MNRCLDPPCRKLSSLLVLLPEKCSLGGRTRQLQFPPMVSTRLLTTLPLT